MKRFFAMILIAAILLALGAGCGRQAELPSVPAEDPIPSPAPESTDREEPEEAQKEEPALPAEPAPTEQEPPAEDAVEEEEPPAPEETPEEAPPAEEADPSYLEKIAWADQSVFAEPNYDSSFVGTVELAGTYTIVEEAYDEEGNLWGRLKSGMGWVDLTDIRSEARQTAPISANFADERLLEGGNYHSYSSANGEYALQIAFRAQGALKDLTICTMVLNETMEPAEVIYALEELSADLPLVAELTFPGDMTCYGLRFTDGSGAERFFILSVSGRNGMICLAETQP